MTQKKANDPTNATASKRYNLAAERVRLGMTQEQLADALSCNVETLGEWENDASAIPGEAMVKASGLFGCSLDYLLGQSNERITIPDNRDLLFDLELAINYTIDYLNLLADTANYYINEVDDVKAQEAFFGMRTALLDRKAALESLTNRF